VSAVVERIEKYTTRERERMERDDETPPIIHVEERYGSRTALCGAPVRGVIVPKSVPLDCVVCQDLLRGLLS